MLTPKLPLQYSKGFTLNYVTIAQRDVSLLGCRRTVTKAKQTGKCCPSSSCHTAVQDE